MKDVRAKSETVFDREEFLDFLRDLKVETKELGIVSLGEHLLGTQRYFIDELAAGLADGIHYFVILKARQIGLTTICLALDLYWHYKHAGTQGTLATDTEENREMFRSTLELYSESLPTKWRQPVRVSNRTQMVFANRSRMLYQVAGTRGENRGFGAGKAIMYVHATEVGRWGQGIDIASFEASLAETNPKRLYIFESTAYGFNNFNEMWDTANEALTQRAIFIGWWRDEQYRVPRDGEIYRVYWDGALTETEKKWCEDVHDLYGFTIDDEQIAWHRFTLMEKMKGDEQQMHEKYPPTADYAFIMTGAQFFSVKTCTEQMKEAKLAPFTAHRFVFGQDFADTGLADATEKTSTLKIWELPMAEGCYAIGADPAWGSSEWADQFAINVSRCWADGMEQVAEFCTTEMNTYQFAWVMLYLAAAYGDPDLRSAVMINLELNGPGMAVWSEIQSLKRRMHMSSEMSAVSRMLQNIQNFLYRRMDNLSGGYSYHTKTNASEKERMMNLLKDAQDHGSLIVKSVDCLSEMRNVIRVDGSLTIEAPGRKKDDRVVAQALSTICWSDMLLPRLIQGGVTKAKQREREANPKARTQGRNIERYLQDIGLVKKPSAQGVRR